MSPRMWETLHPQAMSELTGFSSVREQYRGVQYTGEPVTFAVLKLIIVEHLVFILSKILQSTI